MSKWTERRPELEALIANWATLATIAKHYGVVPSRISRVLRELGLETREMERRRIFVDEVARQARRAERAKKLLSRWRRAQAVKA